MTSSRPYPLWIWFILGISVLGLGLYIRLYPLRAQVWSQSNDQATIYVISKLKSMIALQVQTEYPNASPTQQSILIEKQFAQTLHQEAAMVKKTIREAAKNIRISSDEDNHRIYLQEADGYYYLDLTKNILEQGTIAEHFKGSKFLNEKMAAPFGYWQPINWHPYVGYWIYKTFQIFNKNIDLIAALSWTGPILSAFTLIAFFLLSRSLDLSPLSSFVGSAYFYLAPIFVKRSTFAWYDDDSYNLFFPLLALYILMNSLKGFKHRRDVYINSLLLALIFSIYAVFWHGWGYTFGIIVISSILIILLSYISRLRINFLSSFLSNNDQTPDNKNFLIFFILAIIATCLGISFMFGVQSFGTLLFEGFRDLKKLTSNQLSLWPNLFVSVGELNRSTFDEIIKMTGGKLLFILSILGMILGWVLAIKNRNPARCAQLLVLVLLLIIDFKITFGAQRFILFCILPLSIFLAFTFEFISQKLDLNWANIHHKWIQHICFAILSTVFVVIPFKNIHAQIPELLNVIYNSTWDKALIAIEQKTPPNSIITSWWSPGHFIKAISRRKVTFDGATLGKNKEAYWIANALLDRNEHRAAGILRMLNTHATEANDYLESIGYKTSQASSILHLILGLNKNQALLTLKDIMSQENAQKLISLTHEAPPPSYLLIYSELMEKNIGLQFVGKWNFEHIEKVNESPNLLSKIPPANSPSFFEYLWQTIGGPFKYSPAFLSISQNGSTILFSEGIKVDLANNTASIQSPTYGNGIPQSIILSDGKKVIEHVLDQANLSYSLVVVREGDHFFCRLMDRELANSVLVKLFFFKGIGLEYFRPFTWESDLTGRDEIGVFELNREKLLTDL